MKRIEIRTPSRGSSLLIPHLGDGHQYVFDFSATAGVVLGVILLDIVRTAAPNAN